MKIHNALPLFLQCLERWEHLPSEEAFQRDYFEPLAPWLSPMMEDFGRRMGGGFYATVKEIDWAAHRTQALQMNAEEQERRLRKHIGGVENILGLPLEGETVLFGSFTLMDGYARFDRGRHRVFLGVDEGHAQAQYLDVLMSHELTHVARESRPEVWQGFGLTLEMSHDEFTENQPVIEHLFSEGFSCAVSEMLVPDESAWHYAYQTPEGLARVAELAPAIDEVIHRELQSREGDYGLLYDVSRYHPPVPRFAHYVWAWKWVKTLIEKYGQGDPRRILSRCSRDFMADALTFRLQAHL